MGEGLREGTGTAQAGPCPGPPAARCGLSTCRNLRRAWPHTVARTVFTPIIERMHGLSTGDRAYFTLFSAGGANVA